MTAAVLFFGGSYYANAVAFDGTNDYLTKSGGLAGAIDNKELTGSFWYKRTSNRSEYIFDHRGVSVSFEPSTSKLSIGAQTAAPTTILNLEISNASIVDTNWHHIVFSVDLTSTSNRAVYLDGSPATGVTWVTYTNDTINWTDTATAAVGALSGGTGKYQGDMADLWITNDYIDLAANITKFYRQGKPAFLGNNGGLVTGTAPLAFFSGATDNWHTNKGSGGGFTEQGALTTATTSPSGA